MKTYLITGGAGFIGSHFIEEILNRGDSRVVNLDKLTYAGSLDKLVFAKGNQDYIFKKGDICDGTVVDELFETYDFDYVVNFAAESHVDRSIKDVAPFLQTNVIGVRVLLDAIKKHWKGQSGKFFLQISTDEVYGSLDEGVFADEEFPLKPGNPYSASKAAADLLVMSYYHTYGLPVMITRCCNNFGQRQYKEKFIPLMIDRLVNGRQIPLYGEGTNKREWIHIKEHCRILSGVLENGLPGEIYNIGSGFIRRNIDVAMYIIKVFNEAAGMNLSDTSISYVSDRVGHDLRYALNYLKVSKLVRMDESPDFQDKLRGLVLWNLKTYGQGQSVEK